MKKQDYINTFAAIVNDAAIAEEEKSASAFSKYEQTEDTDFKREAQRSATHARFNSKLAELSEKALSVCYQFKIDASALVAQSRELKKRLISAVEAIAASDKSKLDKALAAILAYIVASEKESAAITEIQRAMNHSTATQANYFKNFCLFLNIASYDKSAKVIKFDTDHKLFKQLVALFD